jgi:hypothetical protein
MEPAQRTEARTSRVTAPRTCSPIDNRVLDYLGEVHRQAIPSVDLSDFFVGGFHPFSLGCGHHLPPAKPVRMLERPADRAAIGHGRIIMDFPTWPT